MNLLIRNGTLIDPANNREGEFDILIEDDRISAIEPRGSLAGSSESTELDAAGKWIVPGLVDLHVHLREPGFEWKETIQTGSEAAALGGYTTICCMPNTNPVNDTAEVTEYIIKKAHAAGRAHVLPIGAVSIGLQGKKMAHLEDMAKAGCVAFSDDGEPVFDSGLMRRALEWCIKLGMRISCHEEDKCLSCRGSMNESALSLKLGLRGMPTIAEDVMTARDIELAHYTGGSVHICHISSARGVELVRRAKADGIRISCEVTPHHLLLTEDCVRDYDTNFKMSPPLRDEETRQALIAGLQDGTIDAVASDHAPHEPDSKLVEFERATMGILGLQTSLPLLLEFVREGILSRVRAVEALSTGPARAFGLEAGTLSKGARADITLIDPEHRWSFDREALASLSRNSPFLGKELQGVADTVILAGRIVVQGRELVSV